ncbi:hypothetical protein HK101_004806 [Irineochytrium annulatum]|nr:hypothetical protein HK101_004806 [Irineochytrium annulatum]
MMTNASKRQQFGDYTFPTYWDQEITLDPAEQAKLVARPITDRVTSGIFKEGGGFMVRRPFPTRSLQQVDPFLMVDHLGPKDYKPYEFPGAPEHPHRGFETVSYNLAGESVHKDSQGYTGHMHPGWVQWMTAGAGVVHDERPTEAFSKTGGIVEGFQIWVNLRASRKMKRPRYQDYAPERLPKMLLKSPEGKELAWCNVIAGEAHGVKAQIETESPIVMAHYILKPGAKVTWQVKTEGWNLFCYLIRGKGVFGGKAAVMGDMVRYAREHGNLGEVGTSGIVIECPEDAEENLMVLLAGGEPLDEPMARYGPFVMNTEEEIKQAFIDYKSGKFGLIAPEIRT